MYVESITLLTKEYNEYTVITPKVLDIVKRSGVQNGTVTVLTKHTTTGVTVNEALECLESDIENFLGRLIPEDYPYSHACNSCLLHIQIKIYYDLFAIS